MTGEKVPAELGIFSPAVTIGRNEKVDVLITGAFGRFHASSVSIRDYPS